MCNAKYNTTPTAVYKQTDKLPAMPINTSFDNAKIVLKFDDGESDIGYISKFLNSYSYPASYAIPVKKLGNNSLETSYEENDQTYTSDFT